MALGRPFNATTPLGQLMVNEGIGVKQLEADTGISYRTISDYLASRKTPTSRHMIALCERFGVSREQILGQVELDADDAGVIVAPADKVSIAGQLKRIGVAS